MRSLPSIWAIMIVPMLDDRVTMSVTDQLATACGSWSEKRWSDTCSRSGTCSTVSGFTRPSSIAADAVITLLTEPGSNTAVSASFALDTTGWPVSGSMSTLAIASTSPVRGSWMIARAPRAPTAATCRSSACSVANCNERSIVSTTSSPGCAGSTLWRPTGIVRPCASRSRTSRPGAPASRASYSPSTPDTPLLSMSTRPTIERASSPEGETRPGSSMRNTPGRCNPATRCADESSIWRAT